MLNSNVPESLTNQVSSESLDTFFIDLSTTSGREDLEMEQSDSPPCENIRHSNVKHPSGMPSAMPSMMSISNDPQDNHVVEGTQDSKQTVKSTENAARIENDTFNDAIEPQTIWMGDPITTANAVPGTQAFSGTVPEFLYQLFKMLTDNNREVIEWADGKIKVHAPVRLQNEILHNYFRHSKFASFQRQLNYFGFRKLAGKGKMSPCSYVNDTIGDDLNRLMLIKRKTGPAGAKDGRKTRKTLVATGSQANDTLTKALQPQRVRRRSSRTNQGGMPPPPPMVEKSTASVLARQAVGKGVRHNITSSTASLQNSSSSSYTQRPTTTLPPHNKSSIDQSLSELETNYRSSLAPTTSTASHESPNDEFFGGFLSRNSSLVDLAMIPPVDGNDGDYPLGAETFNFIDFPNPEVDPMACLNSDNDDE